MDIYTTPDRGRAAYFKMNGENCIGCVPANDPVSPTRQLFVFVDLPPARAKTLEDRWLRYAKEVMSARDFFDSMRTMVHMAKNPMSKEEYEELRMGDR